LRASSLLLSSSHSLLSLIQHPPLFLSYSHTGGHKYAGNVLIFIPDGGVSGGAEPQQKKNAAGGGGGGGGVKGVWYGYVTPLEIPSILERTIGRGEIIPRLWRGSMGVHPEEHEAMAAAEAARLGEEWPPSKSPCDACAETGGAEGGSGGEGGGGGSGGGGAVGDIEDVGGGVVKMTSAPFVKGGAAVAGAGAGAGAGAVAGAAGVAAAMSAPYPPLWVDNILKTSALVGAAGVAASWFMAASSN
jgi:(2Fe-2S) ferredoxin